VAATAVSRQVVIGVHTEDGEPIAGALIDVYLNGRQAASIVSSGVSSVEVSDPRAALSLKVSVGGETRRIDVALDQTNLDLVFRARLYFQIAPTPGGRCPDGTTGQPCVTCLIDGNEVRVCG